MKIKNCTIITFFCLSSQVIIAQAKKDTTVLSSKEKAEWNIRIKTLEGQKENNETTIKLGLQRHKNDINQKLLYFETWLKYGSIGLLGLLAFLVYYIRKFAKTQAEEEVKKQIAKVVQSSKDKITVLLQSQ
ncbi:hypothetical protein, partial [Microscilla marina]|uniref:hypothetical protein n=1 Tax=Microscilla marina TaxID=1027 RepID=UPI0005D48221